MGRLIDDMKITLDEAKRSGLSPGALRVRLKEELQNYVLDYLYNSPEYRHLTMYGGTCLRICFDLNRMSEDIDFETNGPFNKKRLAKEIENYFSKTIQYRSVTTHVPGKGVDRVEIRFPILHELGLSPHEEENLIVKVEVKKIDRNYPFVLTTVTEGRFSFVIRHYPLSILMAGKICACLERQWERRGVKIKGRDYYDLIWYMQKGVIPDNLYLKDSGYAIGGALEELDKKVKTIQPADLLADLPDLFDNPTFPSHWAKRFGEQFSFLKDRYRTAPVVQEPDCAVERDKDFDLGNSRIRVSCRNKDDRGLTFTFSFSEEWVDDQGPSLGGLEGLENLAKKKVKEYLGKAGGKNVIPGRYQTRVIVNPIPANRNDDWGMIKLNAKGFQKILLEALLDRRTVSL